MPDRLAEVEGYLVQGHWDEDWAKDDVKWMITKIKQLRALLQRGMDIDDPNEVDDFDTEVRAALND